MPGCFDIYRVRRQYNVMNRRQVLLSLLASLSLSRLVEARGATGMTHCRNACELASRMIVDCHQIGKIRLAQLGSNPDRLRIMKQFQNNIASRDDPVGYLTHQIQQDIKHNRLIEVQGWLITVTQANIAAFLAYS